MKKITLALMVAMAACTGSKQVAMTQTDADRASAKFPGATLASLNEGKKHYEENCGKCHGLKAVTWGNERQWLEIIPPMAEKAAISEDTQLLITQYLVTACEVK
ncbi:MAG: hypothetical protein ACKVOR_01335 [Flavobacteriales bacterium]